MRNRLPRLRWIACALVLSTGSGCAVHWNLNYQDALNQAKAQNRPMLLYFKDWSSPNHRNLVIKVFEHPAVAAELSGTVNVELLYNWGPEPRQFNVQKSQLCVFCRPDGTEVDRFNVNNPVPSPEEFVSWLKRAKEKLKSAPAVSPAPTATGGPSTTRP
ncbi:MAG: hypothetical protein L6Q92_00720 [Phycisphaerae bacterium]|nr:hypothetical protein [Phycisphaerae bacterium]